MTTNEIHITHAALEADDDYFDQDVLRGRIDQDCLRRLEFDWYQRRQGFSSKEIREIAEKYMRKQKLTDIIVGMRGHRYRMAVTGSEFWLLDKCYTIDGGQRVYAARTALAARPDLRLSIGVKVYFDTTSDSENKMFCEMNSTQQRMSASVMLRNQSRDSHAADLLCKLSVNNEFVLGQMIGWDQKQGTGDILSGFAFACIVGALHAHKGGAQSGRAMDVLDSLDLVLGKVADETVMMNNIMHFFAVIDRCWDIQNATRKDKPACLNPLFLTQLARLFANYDEFWDGTARNEFFVSDKYVKRLAKLADGKIKQQLLFMQHSDIDAKNALLEMLRQKLGLKPFEERRPPPDPDIRPDA
jgi:DNA-binding transcriptional MerR regulator